EPRPGRRSPRHPGPEGSVNTGSWSLVDALPPACAAAGGVASGKTAAARSVSGSVRENAAYLRNRRYGRQGETSQGIAEGLRPPARPPPRVFEEPGCLERATGTQGEPRMCVRGPGRVTLRLQQRKTRCVLRDGDAGFAGCHVVVTSLICRLSPDPCLVSTDH